MRKTNILVSSKIIIASTEEDLFLVPDVSGSAEVHKKVALYFANQGYPVWAINPASWVTRPKPMVMSRDAA